MSVETTTALLEIARLLSEATTSREVLASLAAACVQMTGADAAAIFEVTREGRLVIVAEKELPAAMRGFSDDVDAMGAELAENARLAAGGAFPQARAIPMISGGNIFGALVLFFRKKTAMADETESLTRGLVNLAASAMAKAAQHTQLAHAHEELRASQDTLVRTEKLRSLGEMAAGLSHDLKNVVGPLVLHLKVAERALDRKQEADVRASLAECQLIVRRANEMLERLRDFSRQTPESRVEQANLDRLAHEALQLARPRMASRGGRVNKIVEELGAPPAVPAHSSEVVSALVNLLVNAIDATPEGGTITLRTGVEGARAFVTVADEGPGMAPEVRDKVFAPFFTTKGEKGTGLGLAMVYACMQRHGGSVTLDTALGKGATFTLWFPIPVG